VTMQAASLEILEKAALPPAQARAIVQAIEIEIAGAKDTLATKHDMLLLRHEVTEKLGELRSEIHAAASANVGRCMRPCWVSWPCCSAWHIFS